MPWNDDLIWYINPLHPLCQFDPQYHCITDFVKLSPSHNSSLAEKALLTTHPPSLAQLSPSLFLLCWPKDLTKRIFFPKQGLSLIQLTDYHKPLLLKHNPFLFTRSQYLNVIRHKIFIFRQKLPIFNILPLLYHQGSGSFPGAALMLMMKRMHTHRESILLVKGILVGCLQLLDD